MRGRKPKPLDLRIAEADQLGDKLRNAGLRPLLFPRTQRNVPDSVRKLWRRLAGQLVGHGLWADVYAIPLLEYCETYVAIDALRGDLADAQRSGLSAVEAHKLFGPLMTPLATRLIRFASELGLTPLSMLRLLGRGMAAGPPVRADDGLAEFCEKREAL